MDRSIISRVEEWESRPVPGGYVGLNELADAEFTGAVTAGGTRLFMLNGRVVGVFDGDIAAFEGTDSVAYVAPDPSLPLLFAMQEHGGELRGKYYTDDTPIREVDETLTSSGFTGFLELSENVLSGDYFVVYYGGRSLSAAFVGNEGRTVTGDEAFDLAADEVGIYEVTAVDLEVTDVPEPPEDATATEGGPMTAGEETSGDPDGGTESDGEDGEPDEAPGQPDEPAPDEGTADEPPPTADEAGPGDTEPVSDEGTADGSTDAEPVEPAVDDETAVADAGDMTAIQEAEPSAAASATDTDDGPPETAPVEQGPDEAATGQARTREAAVGTESDERFEEEARWREAATVPALDPDESAPPQEGPSRETSVDPEETPAEPPTEPATSEDVAALNQRIQRLEARLEETERERRELGEQLAEVEAERDDLADERDSLVERIEELEARLEAAESTASEATSSTTGPSERGRTVEPETALDQTDLFVRYGSKAKATLETAHEGRASADDVAENLRVETHSRFDTATATVDGRPFEEYLEGTIQYRFVRWLVEELIYEIQETGTEAGLKELYDVLPALDRAEFNGSVTCYDEEGDEVTETFDVVCRDGMGQPLIVANINDSLDPATGDMMARLVEDATDVAEVHESIGAAFLVTASFFEPVALETAAEATRGGGFLSRDSKNSFVKLARNGGYHLCLVEARGDDFHVAVPEF